jgi:glycerol uptake facilitator-like aquaporin
MDERNLRVYLAELVGTFAVVFLSAGAVCVNALGGLQPGSVSIALAAGLIYAAALALTVPLGGGYLNPAVTIALWVFRRFDGGKALALLGVQVLGAAVAGLLLYLLVYVREDIALTTHLGTPQLSPIAVGAGTSGLIKGIAIELVLSFLLVFAVFGTTLDPRMPGWAGAWAGRLGFLWVGLVLAAATIVGYPLTGGAVNPVRWLGPALWDLTLQSDAFHNHAVYWVGPITGALLAGWLYTAFILPSEEEQRLPRTTAASAGSIPAPVSSTLYRAKK